MQDISGLPKADKEEIAGYLKRDTMDKVNRRLEPVKAKRSFYTLYGKRFLDIFISLIILIITSPINLILAVVTFFDVGRPIIFKQYRIGKDEKKFALYKFRNMTNETDAKGELLPPAQRVTRWGKFVRKTSLDELLNFWSILNGSMSIIGPRPLLDYYAERMNKRHKGIYLVRPGLECPGLKKVDHVLSWQERLDNYVWYVENCSFLVDIKMCLRIVQIALDRKSTSQRSNAGQGALLGYDEDGNVIYTKSVPDKYVEEFCRKHGHSNLEQMLMKRYEE